MIIDLNRFLKEERPYWAELEMILGRLERDSGHTLAMADVQRFHYLYQRASADLARIVNFSAEQDIRVYLEGLVGNAFAEIHETRRQTGRIGLIKWFFRTFPATFRRQITAFWVSLAIMTAGCVFGTIAIGFDSDSKDILMPFSELMGDPSERVAKEESMTEDRLEGHKSTFSTYLMTHNTKVSIFAMGLGTTWGIGTIILLFSNGVMLGAVIADYVLAGQTKFLVGWLLPHGSVEIPAIILAGQAGLVLASTLIGWGRRETLRTRLRKVSGDLVTLIGGVAVMLVWAGFVEAFLSQYHEPVLPYTVKITFGIAELVLLVFFFARGGKQAENKNRHPANPHLS